MFSEGGGAGAGGFKGIIWFLEVVEGGAVIVNGVQMGIAENRLSINCQWGGGGWVGHKNVTEL